ncbi:MAG: DUF4350 domain-containing protein [Candidatus Eremiobacteraeota bacterium]|nr:DUF4350 domain-containing protein [Candidatus Eremiobacteraeota bacterium]
MRRRTGEAIALGLALAVVIVTSIATHSQQHVSTHSTYDSGKEGFLALYNVLAREGVPVRRYFGRISKLDPSIHVLVLTDTSRERFGGGPSERFTERDLTHLRAFARRHRIVVFSEPGSSFAQSLRGIGVPLDARTYGNSGLDANPRAAGRAYEVVAGRGIVAFDERIHGYAIDRSFWEAIPSVVRAAGWIVIAIVALMLIEQNIRFAPAIHITLPEGRDSSSYIRSMGALLRRGRARGATIARLEEDARRLAMRRAPSAVATRELERLRAVARAPMNDAAVVQAAQSYAVIRKELA